MSKQKKTKPDKLEKILTKHNLSQKELDMILKQNATPEKKKFNVEQHYWRPRRVKLGFIADTHIGHSFFNYSIYEASRHQFKKNKVEAIYHCGDVLEGMSNREGHFYELKTAGVSNQIKEAKEVLEGYDLPVYFITGNHDEWATKKSNQGISVGDYLDQVTNEKIKHIGDFRTDIELAPKVKLRLTHEGTGAYALSYSLQKRINALEGGTKPNIIVNGHPHKAIQMFYRNIHAFEAGTLCDQTPFMAMKGSPAHTGFWILDIAYNKKGITDLKAQLFPFY